MTQQMAKMVRCEFQPYLYPAPCSMTVFMWVTLARNRATSNMPSATVFFVAYRFMFRLEPELPGTCLKKRDTNDPESLDGYTGNGHTVAAVTTEHQSGLRLARCLSTTSREFCVLCPQCVCVCACARLYQMNDKGSNPAAFAFEDVFHCR